MSSDDEDMEGSAADEHAAGSSWKPLTDLLSPEEHPLVHAERILLKVGLGLTHLAKQCNDTIYHCRPQISSLAGGMLIHLSLLLSCDTAGPS